MLTNFFTPLLLAVLLASQVQAPALPAPPRQAAGPESYLIGPQDELQITVFDEPGLTGKYRVDETGFIVFGYISRIAAGGMTVPVFQDRLRHALTEFIRNPQVRVAVETYRSQSVMVSGAVRAPQKVPITGTSTSLLEALALSGSATADASNQITVRRRSPTPADPHAVQEHRLNRRDLETGRVEFLLRDGDIINVPLADKFYVDGFVRNPGTFVLDPGMTIQQAIVLAGGLSDRGSDRNIRVRRIVNGKTIEVAARRDDKVLPDDYIYIAQRMF